MENLLDNLKSLLQKDERLVSEGELLKNKIIELALKLDKDLIKLLLSDEKMKEVFFVEVDGTLIFDKDKFVKFISNKQFLPDSYTAFKNKIGLIDEKGEFISEKKEVVLSWPYKDCVLEGGMTKEDQKRDEVFWNEILAPDEISRLLDPKVFTNAKRKEKGVWGKEFLPACSVRRRRTGRDCRPAGDNQKSASGFCSK
jgi:adenine-specific DNA-methyltransferase